MPFPHQNTYDPLVLVALKSLIKWAKVPPHVLHQDLLQAGSLALHLAHRTYAPESNDNFDAYAFNRIRWAMYDEIRSHYLFHHSRNASIVSLDGPATSQDPDDVATAPHLLDILSSDVLDDSLSDVELFMCFTQVLTLLPHLPIREQQILYSSLSEDAPSQRQLATSWSLTEARISQLRKQAIARLSSLI